MARGRKLFLSHSSKDKEYVDIFVELLINYGFREQDVFYSSNNATGINFGEKKFDRIKEEFDQQPVVIYFLSKNYYDSVACLNEMGASWVLAQKQYPVALPGFHVDEMKGAVSSDRLSLILDETTNVCAINNLLESLSSDTGVKVAEKFKLNIAGHTQPFLEQLKNLINYENYLYPDEAGYFEATLGELRRLSPKVEQTFYCFKLPKVVNPVSLGVEKLDENESHWLFFKRSLVKSKLYPYDKVRFKLQQKTPFENKEFKDVDKCKNIYVCWIEKVE